MSQLELERKFIVEDLSILNGSEGVRIEQAYPWIARGWAIRVRVTTDEAADHQDRLSAYLTLKGPRRGLGRVEYEIPLDAEDAAMVINLCELKVVKTRHPVISVGLTWEIDVFHGENDGLVIAELEMQAESELSAVKIPWWAGEEVTGDPRYANDNLAARPFQTWNYRRD